MSFQCKKCNKSFSRKNTLQEHVLDMHKSGAKSIRCQFGRCQYTTNRVGNFNLHLINKHSIHLPLNRCRHEKCSMTKRNEESLVKHMKKCRGSPKFFILKCNVPGCGKELCTMDGLRTHMMINHCDNSEEITLNDLMNFDKKISF